MDRRKIVAFCDVLLIDLVNLCLIRIGKVKLEFNIVTIYTYITYIYLLLKKVIVYCFKYFWKYIIQFLFEHISINCVMDYYRLKSLKFKTK